MDSKEFNISVERKQWKKILYENQGFPDNYTDKTIFLRELKHNIGLQEVSFTDSMLGATLLVQEFCTVIGFVITYIYLYNEWVLPYNLYFVFNILALLGFVIYRAYFSEGFFKMFGHDVRTVLIYLAFGKLFSPVLHTLTDTISTDTIYSMTVVMMLVHLIFFDYGVSAAIVSNSLSLSAAVFGSICLASRLASAHHAFVLITIAIEAFVLFPLIRNKIQKSRKLSLIMTLLMVVSVVSSLYVVTKVYTAIVVSTLIFLNLVCPILFTRYQKYKMNIYGPWDEAIVVVDSENELT